MAPTPRDPSHQRPGHERLTCSSCHAAWTPTCTGCHGIPGYNNIYPTYKVPKIGGQNFEYLVIAVKAYRDGERDHPTMELQASSLSDTDIEDVSAYFASLGDDRK